MFRLCTVYCIADLRSSDLVSDNVTLIMNMHRSVGSIEGLARPRALLDKKGHLKIKWGNFEI